MQFGILHLLGLRHLHPELGELSSLARTAEQIGVLSFGHLVLAETGVVDLSQLERVREALAPVLRVRPVP